MSSSKENEANALLLLAGCLRKIAELENTVAELGAKADSSPEEEDIQN